MLSLTEYDVSLSVVEPPSSYTEQVPRAAARFHPATLRARTVRTKYYLSIRAMPKASNSFF